MSRARQLFRDANCLPKRYRGYDVSTSERLAIPCQGSLQLSKEATTSIKIFLQDLEEAGVVEWAIVIATALLDIRTVERLLQEYHFLCPAFHAMLAAPTWSVCISLCFCTSLPHSIHTSSGYAEFRTCVQSRHQPICAELPPLFSPSKT